MQNERKLIIIILRSTYLSLCKRDFTTYFQKSFYFLVYDDLKAVLMVSISDKKEQQDTIDKIKDFLPEFRKLMENLCRTI